MASLSDFAEDIEMLQTELEEKLRAMLQAGKLFPHTFTEREEHEIKEALAKIDQARAAYDEEAAAEEEEE